MSVPPPAVGRATLAHGYRNLSEREIRAKLEAPLSDAERATANAELLRRGAGSDAADTTFATGFAPTSAFDLDVAGDDDAASADAAGRWRAWPWLLAAGGVLLLVLAATWAMRSKLVHVASAWGG